MKVVLEVGVVDHFELAASAQDAAEVLGWVWFVHKQDDVGFAGMAFEDLFGSEHFPFAVEASAEVEGVFLVASLDREMLIDDDVRVAAVWSAVFKRRKVYPALPALRASTTGTTRERVIFAQADCMDRTDIGFRYQFGEETRGEFRNGFRRPYRQELPPRQGGRVAWSFGIDYSASQVGDSHRSQRVAQPRPRLSIAVIR